MTIFLSESFNGSAAKNPKALRSKFLAWNTLTRIVSLNLFQDLYSMYNQSSKISPFRVIPEDNDRF
jgi:hypothetical protein